MLSDLALEVVGDTAIVWLLSPKAAFGARPTGGLARFTASLPGYCLQVSPRCGMLRVHASIPDVKHSHTSTTQACEVHSDLGLCRNTSAALRSAAFVARPRYMSRRTLANVIRTGGRLSGVQAGADFRVPGRPVPCGRLWRQCRGPWHHQILREHPGDPDSRSSGPTLCVISGWISGRSAAAALEAAQCHCWLPVALAPAGGAEQLAGLPTTDATASADGPGCSLPLHISAVSSWIPPPRRLMMLNTLCRCAGGQAGGGIGRKSDKPRALLLG